MSAAPRPGAESAAPTFGRMPEPELLALASSLLGAPVVTLEPLTAEAGDRRYLRPQPECGWLVVVADSPPPLPTTAWLARLGLRVPKVRSPRRLGDGPGPRHAWLVEDLGDELLARRPDPRSWAAVLAGWERFAFRPLPEDHPRAAARLDGALFRRELRKTVERWLVGHRHVPLGAAARREVEAWCDALAEAAADGPDAVQHRDLHSRNLVHLHVPATTAAEVAWLDHQDLQRGPLFYDLASLATDAYVDLPTEVVERLLPDARDAWAASHGLDPAEAEVRYHTVALQRVLKALGTFGDLLGRGRREYVAAEARARRLARELCSSVAPHGPGGRGRAPGPVPTAFEEALAP